MAVTWLTTSMAYKTKNLIRPIGHTLAIGTPVILFIHAIIQSTNYAATVQYIKACRYMPRASVKSLHQTSEWGKN